MLQTFLFIFPRQSSVIILHVIESWGETTSVKVLPWHFTEGFLDGCQKNILRTLFKNNKEVWKAPFYDCSECRYPNISRCDHIHTINVDFELPASSPLINFCVYLKLDWLSKLCTVDSSAHFRVLNIDGRRVAINSTITPTNFTWILTILWFLRSAEFGVLLEIVILNHPKTPSPLPLRAIITSFKVTE